VLNQELFAYSIVVSFFIKTFFLLYFFWIMIEELKKGKKKMTMRIAKYLARLGVCSRREAEKLIAQERVTVNGEVLSDAAFNVTGDEKILLDGEKLPQKQITRLWLYHKPAGLVTTHKDEKNRPTVFDNLPPNMPRVISIGRLDLNSEGLLLLTNDGELSRYIELPSNAWVRRYKVRVFGNVDEKKLKDLQNGIVADGVEYGPIKAVIESKQGANTWLMVSLSEGKNREVRKVMKHIGLEVSRLIRLSYGPFQLGSLKKGEVKEVPHKTLVEQLGSKFEL
jgi:23S rRNA pseudouridine2605 synthase